MLRLGRRRAAGAPAAGSPPPPRAAEDVLVCEWIDGAPLDQALDRHPSQRRGILEEVGRLVRGLHAAGWTHG